MQEKIEKTLHQRLNPDLLEIINESYKHNVPDGAESHFKVTLVTSAFTDLSKIARHKLIYTILGTIMNKIHALSLGLYTPDEWQKRTTKAHESPPCARARK